MLAPAVLRSIPSRSEEPTWLSARCEWSRPLPAHSQEFPACGHRWWLPFWSAEAQLIPRQGRLICLPYRREDAKDKKLAMETYWIPGVDASSQFGQRIGLALYRRRIRTVRLRSRR